MSRRLRMQIEGMPWTVRITGHGQPVLFLHGFSGSGLSWAGVAGLGGRFRAIVPDLPGHGTTGWAAANPRPDARTGRADGGRRGSARAAGRPPPGGQPGAGDPRPRASVERTADDLATILRRLGAERAHVVGYSLGARIGLRLAIDHPEAVACLVLEAPSAGIVDPAARASRVALDTQRAQLAVTEGVAAFAERWEAEPILAGEAALPAPARERQQAIRRANAPLGLAASLVHAGQGVMEPLHDRLAEIRAPTLVIVGADDPVRARAEGVAAAIPNAHLAVVPNAGHAPHLERPDRFHALVLDFLTEAAP